MKNCGDAVLQNFLEELVGVLKEYNEDLKYSNQSTREDQDSYYQDDKKAAEEESYGKTAKN